MKIAILGYGKMGEQVELVAKRAESAAPKSMWASYSAFANTYGGVKLLG